VQHSPKKQISKNELSSEISNDEISSLSLPSELSEPVSALAELHKQLSPENKKLWYRRTGGESDPEAVSLAQKLLEQQSTSPQ